MLKRLNKTVIRNFGFHIKENMEVIGRVSSAIVFTDDVEATALEQIKNLCDHIQSKDAHIRLMPDVHAGAGCVIGYTA